MLIRTLLFLLEACMNIHLQLAVTFKDRLDQ